TVRFTLSPKDLSLLDKDFNRVVEPGDFDIMIGASSTDIRLRKTLRISDGTPEGSVYPDDASAKKAVFPALLGKSEDVTMPLREGKILDYLTVKWGEGTDCEFEILWTKGGGQFLPCYKGSAKGAGSATYKFEGLEGSEVRIGVTRGKANVVSMDSIAIQK
ncbi:MAG: fibronectin type III-like domain-contianing protein, partial [Bacteroidales bacterium]|nr:fibronectin type III-like domain-contianing protein [Bacteroidales bacterium]